jgi:hypothetical protein
VSGRLYALTSEVFINWSVISCHVVEVGLPIVYFICYGGSKGQQVALKIRNMSMEGDLFKPFLAEPHSRDVMSGEAFKAEIDKQIIGSQVMVVVGTCELGTSREALREIMLARRNGIHIIVFVQKGCRSMLPKILRNMWIPIEYRVRNPEFSFDKLRFDIVSTCLRIANSATDRRESNESG